ncbi:MAG: HNH endonuclease signature motif containing protein [Acidimicrobiales bacterium]
MVDGVLEAVAALECVLADFEPGTLSGPDAAKMVDTFAKGERLCATGKALCARRATEARVHRAEGHHSPAAWLAARTGDSVGDAIQALSSAKAADKMPLLEEAMRAGELSSKRVAQVADAVAANPAAEHEMVRSAKSDSVGAFRQRAAQARAAGASAASESDRYEAIRRGRYLRHWSDPDGAFHLDARLTPDDGARVARRIAAMARRLGDQARAEGRNEPHGAHAADALVALVCGPGSPGPGAGLTDTTTPEPDPKPGPEPSSAIPPAQVSVRVDAAALRRGYVEGDEVCEIPGAGPVPVATARALLGDAWLAILVTDGVDIASVCHYGRTIPAHVRTALLERDRTCVVPGCDVAYNLEIDHWALAVEDRGPTCLSNLARVCHHHHLLKTHHGFVLDGGPGHWRWSPPTGPPPPSGPRPPPAPTGQPSLFDTAGP